MPLTVQGLGADLSRANGTFCSDSNAWYSSSHHRPPFSLLLAAQAFDIFEFEIDNSPTWEIQDIGGMSSLAAGSMTEPVRAERLRSW